MKSYTIKKTTTGAPVWDSAETAEVNNFHPESSDHHPRTEAKLLYDDEALHVLFRVEDNYVRATRTQYQDEVYKDSCVEFFIQPSPDHGYFNFEMNCIGTLLLTYIENPTRLPEGGFEKYTIVPEDIGGQVKIQTSFAEPIQEEITEPTNWELQARIPFAVFEHYVGELALNTWRGNFYKCADESSHPHWGSWSPIGDELNFHAPEFFGKFHFEQS